jgi:hypothetical protein
MFTYTVIIPLRTKVCISESWSSDMLVAVCEVPPVDFVMKLLVMFVYKHGVLWHGHLVHGQYMSDLGWTKWH